MGGEGGDRKEERKEKKREIASSKTPRGRDWRGFGSWRAKVEEVAFLNKLSRIAKRHDANACICIYHGQIQSYISCNL